MCSVVLAEGVHPIPFRTRKLSPPAPMVLPCRGWESRTPLNTSDGSLRYGPRAAWYVLESCPEQCPVRYVSRGVLLRPRVLRGVTLKELVQEVLDRIRPALQADGGDVELVDVEGGVVKVRLVGACAGCPMSQLTLANGVERVLKEQIPEVERVEAV